MESTVQKGVDAVTTGGIPQGTALIVDILVLCFILLFAFLGGKKGLYNTFMPLVVIVLAIAIGMAGSRALTPVAHNLFYQQIEDDAVEKFDNTIAAAAAGVTTPKQAFMNQWNKLVSGVGMSEAVIKEQITEPKLVAQAREELKAKTERTFNLFVSWILFGMCTAIGFFFLTLLKNLVGEISDWPVIKWVDGLGGFAIGAITGFIVFFVIVKACGIFKIDFFTGYSEGTTLLKLFTDTY